MQSWSEEGMGLIKQTATTEKLLPGHTHGIILIVGGAFCIWAVVRAKGTEERLSQTALVLRPQRSLVGWRG